ncbi:MAG TPA: fatty acid cis/trans isomerase, partial [Bdellovibrio sp.]
MQFIKAVALCFISVVMMSVSKADDLGPEFYSRKIQPIFDNRCLSCHSCFNAPCQLNLQNYEGFQRGAAKTNVYDGTRVKSVQPSRMWIDAHGESAWRKKGFFKVNNSKKPEENIFWSFIKLRAVQPKKEVVKVVADAQMCSASVADLPMITKETPELGMPYGLPPLNESELATLESWIKQGAPGPSAAEVKAFMKNPAEIQSQIEQWQTYLNAGDLKQKLISRYLYEHLFLAHIYFPEQKDTFFRLVRSKTACKKGIQEIATRRPNDDPGVENFFYCLNKFPGTIVNKTHIPYEWSPQKLSTYKKIFAEGDWKVATLPTYQAGVAENPFIAFKDIPVKARYQFLLEDSQYHVNTFIKGPVCNGSMAVNSIQEQFYVFFLQPEADNMVLSNEYEVQAQSLLMMPGVWGSDIEIIETPIFYKKLVSHREAYRKLRTQWLGKNRPDGYSLKDIWDGDGSNPNAVLTVLRHDDNAVVLNGAVGDLSKTVFVLDYPLLERLVYNLVVNFDVFGNVSHQLLTRIYMDMIRMEAEELFLMFLPPEQRLAYRRSWYQGFLAQAKMTYVYPTVGSAEPTSVRFNKDDADTKKQMIEKILFYRLNDKTRGSLDAMNWRNIVVPESVQKPFKPQGYEKILRKIAGIKGEEKPFAEYFPEFSYLKITAASGEQKVYSIMHNREHENISWILAESLRLAPQEDSLTLREGYWGSYPNMIFSIAEKDLQRFVDMTVKIKNEKGYQELVSAFGVRRTQDNFWQEYDS